MKKTTSFILLAITFLQANAQKLPTVQAAGVTLPANVKIDGKATEWGDQLQVYNTTSDIWYTMANNNDLLYLVIQAKNVNVINTIFGYGFELAIHKSGKKNDMDKVAVNYPVNPRQWANFKKNDVSGDTSARLAAEKMDTNNKRIASFKNIIVSGIPGLDTLSIYNDAGIMAACQFDVKGVYTVEFAIPLKHLGLAGNSASTFAYHMTVNGYKPPKNYTVSNMVMDASGGMSVSTLTPAEVEQGIAELNAKIYARNPRTDFWGEYTLAK